MGRLPGTPKTGGRKPGVPNKINATLKEAILLAAEGAHKNGMVGYLTHQATESPAAFLTLLGKVLPVTGPGKDGAFTINIMTGVDRANGDD